MMTQQFLMHATMNPLLAQGKQDGSNRECKYASEEAKPNNKDEARAIMARAERAWEGAAAHVLREVAELAEDADEAGHGDAIEDGLRVVLVGRAVEVAAAERVLVPDRVPRQGHCPRSLRRLSSSLPLFLPPPAPAAAAASLLLLRPPIPAAARAGAHGPAKICPALTLSSSPIEVSTDRRGGGCLAAAGRPFVSSSSRSLSRSTLETLTQPCRVLHGAGQPIE